MRPTVARMGYGILSVGTVALLWWTATARGLVSPFLLPSPEAVVDAFQRISGGYLGPAIGGHLMASLSVVLSGYFAAVVIGVSLGVAMAWWPVVNTLFGPLVGILRPIPPPAWIPLAILWFGIGLEGKMFVVFVAAVTPCLINSYVSIKEIPPHLIDAARSLGAKPATLLVEVAVPAGLPMILAGMRIALGNAWASVVAAELVVATAGFGFIVMNGYRNFEANIMMAGIIAVGAVGFLMSLGFRVIERRLITWVDHDD
jgi:ABC-type nitrate/sulfonate/bicarbonate transport system permease component